MGPAVATGEHLALCPYRMRSKLINDYIERRGFAAVAPGIRNKQCDFITYVEGD